MSRTNEVEVYQEQGTLERFEEDGLLIEQNLSQAQKEHKIVIQGYNERATQQNPLFLGPQTEIQQDLATTREEWTPEEENLLLDLHNKKGNRWVEIARELRKNDNLVKNHYHSKLRKTLRKINKCAGDQLKGQFRPLKNSAISKIVQTAEGLYGEKGACPSPYPRVAFELKNKILSYSNLRQQQQTTQSVTSIATLVSQIQKFLKDLKNAQKTEVPSKTANNKYKGKQILSLLTENSRSQHTTAHKGYKPTSSQDSRQKAPNPEPQSRRPQQENKTSLSFQASTSLGSLASIPTFVYLNQGFLPFQPFYYPIYSDSSLIMSGGPSSFTIYRPSEDRGAEWRKAGDLQRKRSEDEVSLLVAEREKGSNQSLL